MIPTKIIRNYQSTVSIMLKSQEVYETASKIGSRMNNPLFTTRPYSGNGKYRRQFFTFHFHFLFANENWKKGIWNCIFDFGVSIKSGKWKLNVHIPFSVKNEKNHCLISNFHYQWKMKITMCTQTKTSVSTNYIFAWEYVICVKYSDGGTPIGNCTWLLLLLLPCDCDIFCCFLIGQWRIQL